MGRHHPGSEPAMRWPTITPTRNRIAVLALAATGLTVCSVVGIGDSWAPDGRAATSAPTAFPTADQADDPGARGGPLGGPLAMPVLVPSGTPVWEPAKGTVIADGKALPRSTGSTATRATRTTAPPEAAGPVAPPTEPPPSPPVIVEPPRDCADPLVECESDHDVPPVGLPPVPVEEEPAVEPTPQPEPETPVDIGIIPTTDEPEVVAP